MDVPRLAAIFIFVPLLVACEANRTPPRDVGIFVKSASTLSRKEPSETFDYFAHVLGLQQARLCESYYVKCAEAQGRDASTHLLLTNRWDKDGFEISLTFASLERLNTAQVVEERLGKPNGVTGDDRPAWILPSGVIVTYDDTVNLVRTRSGDPHEVAQILAEPHLGDLSKIQQSLSATIHRYSRQSDTARSEMYFVPSLPPAPSRRDGRIGDLVTGGAEVAMGHSAHSGSTGPDFMYIGVATRDGVTFPWSESAALLIESTDTAAGAVIRQAIERIGESPFTTVRSGNFAVTACQRHASTSPWSYRYIILWRRVSLDGVTENQLRQFWSSDSFTL